MIHLLLNLRENLYILHFLINREIDMALSELIRKQISNEKSETGLVPVTIRFEPDDIIELEELVQQLNMTRQNLIVEFVKEGIRTAQNVIREEEVVDFIDDTDPKKPTEQRYYLLNTNTQDINTGMRDHENMLQNGIAAAFFGDRKENINRLKKGDIVFLYQSKVGFVAVGKADGKTVTLDYVGHDGNIYKGETYNQKLLEFKKLAKPITAKESREITKANLPFLKTMSQLSKNHGEILYKAMQTR